MGTGIAQETMNNFAQARGLFVAFVLAVVPRAAAAGDAGNSDGGPDNGEADAGVAMAADDSEGQPGLVIACDGSLCDSLQGRPTCGVATGSIGRPPASPRSLIAVSMVLAIGLVRRATRGAQLRVCVGLLLVGTVLMTGGVANAADLVPQATELPSFLTLDAALQIFRVRGLELLIADANTRSAEGAVGVASAVPNPVLAGSYGYAPTYTPRDPNCNGDFAPTASAPAGYVGCSPGYWTVGISDSAALEDTLSGKRDLRLKVARNALAAAKMSRADAERTLSFQVKSAYLQVAQATLGYRFAKDVADTNVTLLEKVQVWLANGKSGITGGDVARMQTQKSESDQAVDTALQALRLAHVSLDFLLGVRGEAPDYDVDTHVLDYSVPDALRSVTEPDLMRTAFGHRPDLIAAGYTMYSSQAALALVNRQKFPDVTLSLSYEQGGFGGSGTTLPLQTPTFTFGLSAPFPVFYQLQGETRQAQATLDANTLQQAMVLKQVVEDVRTAHVTFVATQALVTRMEKGEVANKVPPILESAKVALDTTRLQWERGAASLTDFLVALQTYIATKTEYYGDLTSYWTAVYQLEEAVGMGFVR